VPWDAIDLVPQFTRGRPLPITGIVWHTLEGSSSGARSWWRQCDCASAEFIIERSGLVVLCVDLGNTAWHAGTRWVNGVHTGRTPYWRAHNANHGNVGIELEGSASQPSFPAAQIEGAKQLARWLTRRYGIPAEHRANDMSGHKRHSEVSNQRSDPGPNFPLAEIIQACR
jgi:N-acetyl-anhydromuramyl-L-alanine amidase AmpD